MTPGRVMIIVGLALLACAFVAWSGIRWSMTLRMDPHNPYTFWCKRCGMRFDVFGMQGTRSYDHLEPVGKVIAWECRCLDPWRREAWFRQAYADSMAKEVKEVKG